MFRCVLLFVCLCVVPIVIGTSLPIFNPVFKDPYSTDLYNVKGALLDICVLPCKAWPNKQLQSISVKIPTNTYNNPNTGYFKGPPFSHKIVGTTAHGSASSSTLTVTWDGTSVITFSGFTDPAASHAVFASPKAGSNDLNWVNVNYDIPDNLFINPYLYPNDPYSPYINPDYYPNKVPLLLVPFYPLLGIKPKIVITDETLFTIKKDDTYYCHSVTGDPVFSGFQGQTFQFHGLSDEHFNLVSSPDVQLNAHFVYLSSGKCDYNDTACFTHPGTYMDVLGFSIADSQVKIVAGTHEQGLNVWINDEQISRGTHVKQFTNTSAYMKYHHNGHVEIHTEIMNFHIANSDMFINLHVSLNLGELLRVGATKHTVTDAIICKSNTETHNHQLIETTVAKKYPVNTPLHGLIGQTWRNVKVCSKDWMGTVQDYITSDLFASDYHYNYFHW